MARLRLLLAAVMLGTLLLVPATAQAAGSPTIPVTGSGPTQTFTGSLTIDRFVRQGGQILAVGTLSGTVTKDERGSRLIGALQVRLRYAELRVDLELFHEGDSLVANTWKNGPTARRTERAPASRRNRL